MSSSMREYFQENDYSIITSHSVPIMGNHLSVINSMRAFLFKKNEALSDIDIEGQSRFVPLLYTQIGGVKRSYINKSKKLLKDIPEFVLN